MFAEYVKYILKIILRNITKVFCLFPIKNNRILFTSLEGKSIYCNPRCIYNFLENYYSDQYEYIWIFNGDRKDTDLPENVKVIRRRTLKWAYYMMTAGAVVDNYPPSLIISSRRKQLYLETWHGGGAYKAVGNANDTVTKNFQKKINITKIRAIKIFVSSSREFTKATIEEGYPISGEILACGMPRNDIFFDLEAIRKATLRVKQYYSLNEIVILYAPTFRGTVDKTVKLSDIINLEKLQEILRIKYHTDVDILVRCHPVDRHAYDFGENVIDVSDYPDMQELLCASDILITDYSSSIWDYAILGRPCLLYTPDIDKYIEDRGLFTPPDQWPGIICRSMDDLCDEILNLDEKACAERAKRHLELMGSYETGHATEIIVDRIVNYLNGD